MAGKRDRIEQVGLDIIAKYLRSVADHYEAGCLYRGHADRDWKAVASVFRKDAYGITKAHDLSGWKSVAQRLASPRPVDDISYLVLAQHYGVATALLDWTSNPLTALFFACLPEQQNSGEVIQASRSQFEPIEHTLMLSPFPESRPVPLLIDTSAMNLRSTAQDSFMSLHTKRQPGAETQSIFVIEHKKKYLVRSALVLLGLTPARVFVDLAVAAAHFKDDMELDWILS